MKRLQTIVKAAIVLMLAVASSQAGTMVVYNFVGTGAPFALETGQTVPAEPVAFQLTVPDFLNPPLNGAFGSFSCAQLDSSTNCDSSNPTAILLGNSSLNGTFGTILFFDASNSYGYIFFFPSGALEAVGVYSAESGDTFNSGTLTVSQTPEVNTILYALSGICICGLYRL